MLGATVAGGPMQGGGMLGGSAGGGMPVDLGNALPKAPPKDTSFYLGDDDLTEMMNEIMSWGLLLVGDSSGWDGRRR